MAKIYGQLDSAQLEQLTSNPSVLPTGRIWMDVSSAAAAVPKVFDGSNVRKLRMDSVLPVVSQNSGTSCTVDWSTGLYQEVILTGHCVIGFANPQSGQEHVLVITQRAMENAGILAVPYIYRLNMTDQDPQRGPYQPTAPPQSSENHTYRWFYVAGIRAGYGTIPFVSVNPSTLPASQSNGIDISPDGLFVCSGNTTTPFASVYQIYDSAIGLKYGNKNRVTPTAAAAAINGVAYSVDGDVIFTVGGTTPFIQGWYADRGTGVTVLSNPGTLPAGAGQSLSVHPSGGALITGHTTSPFMTGWPLTAGAYGTKYTNPGTLPAAQVNAIEFSKTGDYVAVSSGTTPFIQVWPFDIINGFGTVVPNPASLPHGGASAGGKGIDWRPQGDYIAMCSSSATDNYLYVVGFNRATGAFGSVVSTASDTLGAAALCCQWTPDGQYLLVGNSATPFLYVYDFSAATIGAPVAFDGSNPGGQINDMVVAPSGEYVILSLNATPFIKTYLLPRKVRNYLRLKSQP